MPRAGRFAHPAALLTVGSLVLATACLPPSKEERAQRAVGAGELASSELSPIPPGIRELKADMEAQKKAGKEKKVERKPIVEKDPHEYDPARGPEMEATLEGEQLALTVTRPRFFNLDESTVFGKGDTYSPSKLAEAFASYLEENLSVCAGAECAEVSSVELEEVTTPSGDPADSLGDDPYIVSGEIRHTRPTDGKCTISPSASTLGRVNYLSPRLQMRFTAQVSDVPNDATVQVPFPGATEGFMGVDAGMAVVDPKSGRGEAICRGAWSGADRPPELALLARAQVSSDSGGADAGVADAAAGDAEADAGAAEADAGAPEAGADAAAETADAGAADTGIAETADAETEEEDAGAASTDAGADAPADAGTEAVASAGADAGTSTATTAPSMKATATPSTKPEGAAAATGAKKPATSTTAASGAKTTTKPEAEKAAATTESDETSETESDETSGAEAEKPEAEKATETPETESGAEATEEPEAEKATETSETESGAKATEKPEAEKAEEPEAEEGEKAAASETEGTEAEGTETEGTDDSAETAAVKAPAKCPADPEPFAGKHLPSYDFVSMQKGGREVTFSITRPRVFNLDHIAIAKGPGYDEMSGVKKLMEEVASFFAKEDNLRFRDANGIFVGVKKVSVASVEPGPGADTSGGCFQGAVMSAAVADAGSCANVKQTSSVSYPATEFFAPNVEVTFVATVEYPLSARPSHVALTYPGLFAPKGGFAGQPLGIAMVAAKGERSGRKTQICSGSDLSATVRAVLEGGR